jgi:hypothetical protein
MSGDRAKQTAACQLHDRVNMIALPILGGLAFAGLMGWYEPTKVDPEFRAGRPTTNFKPCF